MRRSVVARRSSPSIGKVDVARIDTGHVMKVLEQIWTAKPETASRVRGRIEAVLDWATARKYRSGDNPSRWKGHLDKLLAKRSKVRTVKHHPALPWRQMGEFMAELRKREGTSPRAVELAILTAARSGEVRGATWAEFDLQAGVWAVPPERMKAGREHRVPLGYRAVELLSAAGPGEPGAIVFPGVRGKPLSDMSMSAVLKRMDRHDITVHGFRSAFRDWCAETTNFPREMAELALAHTVGDKVEAAYRRGDMFEKRRQMMQAWERHCSTVAPAGDVLPMQGKTAAGR